MPRKKIKTSIKGEWVHRPGFNWLLGYVEEKPIPKSEGIKVYTIDRSIKDGNNNTPKQPTKPPNNEHQDSTPLPLHQRAANG